MYGIRVNMIIPDHYVALLTAGLINEPLEQPRRSIPIERFGEPDEVGHAAVLLLSDRLSHYTTGTYLVIVGGLHLHPIPLFSDEQICRLNSSSTQELDVKANAEGY